MKNEIVSQTTSHKSVRRARPLATLLAVLALMAYAASSALATQCEPVEFTEDGHTYPQTIYVFATTPTTGATIIATMGNHFIPANPTHGANCNPTNGSFICGGTFAVFSGDNKWFKAIACKDGMTDSAMEIYNVDNSGN